MTVVEKKEEPKGPKVEKVGTPGDDSAKGIHGEKGVVVPAVKVENLQDKAAITVEAVKKNSRQRLTLEQLEAMSPAELRAVATDRGYEVGKGGRKVLPGAFLAEQDKDKSLEASKS